MAVDQVINLVKAVTFSNKTGHPLIVHVTVIWPHFAEFTEDKLGPLTTRFFDKMSKWLRQRGTDLRAVWVRERGQQKGYHFHCLANIPVKQCRDLKAYLQRVFGISGAGLKFTYGQFGMRTLAMQMGALRYACKALDHHAFKYDGYDTFNIADALGIQHTGTDGVIKAKRCGWTENIGPTARRRANWPELRRLDQIAEALNPAPTSSDPKGYGETSGKVFPGWVNGPGADNGHSQTPASGSRLAERLELAASTLQDR